MGLEPLVIGQHILVRPAGVAHLEPVVEVTLLAADIDHRVDGATAALDLAARDVHGAIVELLFRLAVIHPIGAPVVVREHVPDGYFEAQRLVGATCLQQQNSVLAAFSESMRKNAAGGTRADNNVVVRASHCIRVLEEMAAATPAPCPLTAQHIMFRTAAYDTRSPPVERP